MDLAQTTLFATVSAGGIEALTQRGVPRSFPAGSILMTQGELGDTMYVILRGTARVQRTHPALAEPVVLADLSAGQVVGEMGVLDDDPRSATVIAIDDVEAVELTAADLTQVMLQFPDVANTLLRILSKRLRNTNELVELALLQSTKDGPPQS